MFRTAVDDSVFHRDGRIQFTVSSVQTPPPPPPESYPAPPNPPPYPTLPNPTAPHRTTLHYTTPHTPQMPPPPTLPTLPTHTPPPYRQAFHDARTVKEPEKEPEPEEKEEEEKAEAPKPRSLSSNIFGGGAGRPGGLTGGWQARMQERELKQREQALSVDNTFAFPSLKDSMNG